MILLYRSAEVDINDCEIKSIVVEDKNRFAYGNRHGSKVKSVVVSDNVFYHFYGTADAYSATEFYNEVQIGQNIDIAYCKKCTFIGKINKIVEARCGDTVYMDLDGHNEKN